MRQPGWQPVLIGALLVWLPGLAAAGDGLLDRPAWTSMPLPGGTGALAAAAGLPPPVAPERALFDIVRAVHDRPAPRTLAAMRTHLARATAGPAELDQDVPLPLSQRFWERHVFGRPVPSREVAAAILTDRTAALLFVGLASLDGPTLAFVENDARLAGALYGRHAGVLAAFGRSVKVESGAVRVPGGPEALALWERLVGTRADRPAAFIEALLSRDRGRLAYFFDALAGLDPEARRYALGVSLAAERRAAALTRLYRVFREVAPEWRIDEHPFFRPAVSPAMVLGAVEVTSEGRLAPPSDRAFWRAAFVSGRRPPGSVRATSEAEAAWLVAQVFASDGRYAASRLDTVRFAQRLVATSPPASVDVVAAAVEARLQFPPLMASLQRMGVVDADIMAAAGARARQLTARGNELPLLHFQGTLALVERARDAGSLDAPGVHALVRTLIEATEPGDDVTAAVMSWVRADLLPAFGVPDTSSGDVERFVRCTLAGQWACQAGTDAPEVTWEGRRYRVDPAASALDRLDRARRRQAGPTLDDVLAVDDHLNGRTSRVEAVTRRLEALALELERPGPPGDLARRLGTSLREAALGGAGTGGRRLLAAARDHLLADVLVALAYAPYLGDASGAARYGGHVARRHDLGLTVSLDDQRRHGPWTFPVERRDGQGWHLIGSVLGLDSALGRLLLKRLDSGRVPTRPPLAGPLRRQVLAALSTRPLARAGDREAPQTRVDAGRRRVETLVAEPEDLDEVARTLGLIGVRVNALRWWLAEGGAAIAERFSYVELDALGRQRASSVEAAGVGAGSVSRRARRDDVSDLTDEVLLWLDQALAARKLPASLGGGVLEYLVQDLIDEAQPAHADETLAVSVYLHRLPDARVDDFVAALAADGPLREAGADHVTRRR